MQIAAVFIKRGSDDLRDKLAIDADVVGQDVVSLEGVADGVFEQVAGGALEGVVEDAAARVEAGGHTDEGMYLDLVKHIGPLQGDEGVPSRLVTGHHLGQVGVVELRVGFGKEALQFLEGLVMLIGKIGLVTVVVNPFLDFLLERDEVGVKDGINGKELFIGLDDVEGGVEEEDDVLYLHEEAMGIGLAAFGGGVE